MSKQRIIIFDSPDGTGKSNIAKALSHRIGVPYFKMNTEHENWRRGKFKEALEFDQTYLLQLLKQTGHSVIIDRAYPAEWVYSKAFQRQTNEKLLVTLDTEFAALGTNIIIPLRHDYSNNREDELVPNSALQTIHNYYVEFSKWTHCVPVQIYVDEHGDQLHSELEFIEKNLRF